LRRCDLWCGPTTAAAQSTAKVPIEHRTRDHAAAAECTR
jgi:hypothetical protein